MKSKLFICFWPDMTKSNLDSSDFVDDFHFSSASLSSNEYANITKSKSASDERECLKGSGRGSQTQKKNLIRSFSGTVRPALFEISLKKKSRKRKPSQLTIESKNHESSRNDVFSDVACSQNSTTKSSPTSSTSSYPSSTEQELNGKGGCIKTVFVTLNHKKQATDDLRVYSSVGLLCVLTMSLGLTLFYGRVCAVVFTTIWLYFFPQKRNYEVVLPESTTRTSPPDMEVSARDYRKRVIMEGMLERNNPRRIQ